MDTIEKFSGEPGTLDSQTFIRQVKSYWMPRKSLFEGTEEEKTKEFREARAATLVSNCIGGAREWVQQLNNYTFFNFDLLAEALVEKFPRSNPALRAQSAFIEWRDLKQKPGQSVRSYLEEAESIYARLPGDLRGLETAVIDTMIAGISATPLRQLVGGLIASQNIQRFADAVRTIRGTCHGAGDFAAESAEEVVSPLASMDSRDRELTRHLPSIQEQSDRRLAALLQSQQPTTTSDDMQKLTKALGNFRFNSLSGLDRRAAVVPREQA